MESEWPTPPKTILEQATEDVKLLREHALANKKTLEEGIYTPPIVEADAEYDLRSDTILVRVRRRYRDRDGTIHRRGVTFRLTDEMLMKTAEGCEYPHKSIDRFESIVDETE